MATIDIIPIFLFGILALAIIGFSVVAIVPAGNVGVHEMFGEVNPYPMRSGFHFKNPLASVHMMSIRTQDYTMSFITDEGAIKNRADIISALTKEGLSVDLDITVLYSLNPELAPTVYREIGTDYVNVVVRPMIRSIIREVIAKYEAKNIYSESRQEISLEIQNKLQDELKPTGIQIERVLLRNVQLPEKLQEAISDKLETEQEIEKRQFQVESEKMEAERKRIEAQGIADANNIIAESLTQNYLLYQWIQELGNNENTVIYVPVGTGGLPLFKETGA